MLIGIYGYMSTGKTTICEYLENKYNFYTINADNIAKEIINSDKNIKKYLKSHYKNIIDQNNNLIKSNFRNLLFNNWEINQEINNYLWPFVRREIKKILLNKNITKKNIVIESLSLKMLELSWNIKIFLYADFNNLINRIIKRNQLPSELITKILDIQTKIFATENATYSFDTTNNYDEIYNTLDKIVVNF